MIGVGYGTLGSDMVGRGLVLYVGVWYGGPDMVGHAPTLIALLSITFFRQQLWEALSPLYFQILAFAT